MIKTLFLFILLHITNLYSQIPAFPGAEGFGKYTTGGRGGRVIEVTNLNDSGAGSLRNAIKQDGARTIVFRVSGTIELESELRIDNGNLTIAGQTAPGDGISIRNYSTILNADNIIIRFLRFRLGDEKKEQADALTIMNCKNIIIDHCSCSWGIDEVLSCYDNENTTVQWCIISEALNSSVHEKGAHGYGGIWGGKNASFIFNLLSHNTSRNPRFNGSRTKYSPDEELVDYRNNVIYNWGFNSVYGGENASYNIVDNYYKPGPATLKDVKSRIVEPWDNKSRWYISGNFVEGYPEVTSDNTKGIHGEYAKDKRIFAEKPFVVDAPPYESAQKAYNKILKYAGAVLPSRDRIDERITEDVRSGSAQYEWKKYKEEYKINDSIITGIIDSQSEAGGWPELKSKEAPADSDNDGMPDQWEKKMNLNPTDPSDGNKTAETGYTYLEEYLNELAKDSYPL